MASLNAVVVPAKVLKGGRHKIRIAIAHNGETRYIVTDIVIDSVKEFRNGSVVKRPDAAYLNTKLRKLLQRYQESMDNLPYPDGLTCAELVSSLKNEREARNRTLQSIYDEYVETSNSKSSTVRTYKVRWHKITEHLSQDMIVDNITHATVLGLDKFLLNQGLKPSTRNFYMNFFVTLVKYAKRCGYVSYKINPFDGYKRPEGEVRQSWLTVEEIRRLRDYKFTSVKTSLCRDIFMLSYYLGGINIVDLLKINFNEQKTVIHYVRTKTKDTPKINKFVEFAIPSEALEIIERYKGKDGLLKFYATQYKFLCSEFFSRYFRNITKETGIKGLIYYSARKSFAQHAFNLGISESVIDYILGHKLGKGGSSLFNYLYVTPQMATEAIRKVLDNLKE